MIPDLDASGAFGGHGLHLILLLGGWALMIGGWTVAERLRARRGSEGSRLSSTLPGLASPRIALVALATSVSAAVHLAVSPEHFRESTDYGIFFVSLASAQLAWSVVLLRRPSVRLLRVGGAVSAAVVLLWLETRLVGAGFGPLRAGREELGLPDLVATLAELWLVVVALRTARIPVAPVAPAEVA